MKKRIITLILGLLVIIGIGVTGHIDSILDKSFKISTTQEVSR